MGYSVDWSQYWQQYASVSLQSDSSVFIWPDEFLSVYQSMVNDWNEL